MEKKVFPAIFCRFITRFFGVFSEIIWSEVWERENEARTLVNGSENWATEKEAINLKGPFQSIEALKESIDRNGKGELLLEKKGHSKRAGCAIST